MNPTNPHLHNVPMQIAAERGLPALGAWLWFVASATTGLLALLRRTRNRSLAAAGLGAMAANAGGAPMLVSAARITFWGALAMALTAGAGALFGTGA